MSKANCLVCGSEFTFRPSRAQKLCGNRCKGQHLSREKIQSIPEYVASGEFTTIRLSNSEASVIVDSEIAGLVSRWKWYLSDTGYAVRRDTVNGKKVTYRLHRLIAGATDEGVVDHINRNKLDNRKSNLRITTQSVNVRNADRFDQAKYYYHSKKRNHWIVDFREKGIGYRRFSTEREAALFVATLTKSTI